MPRVDVAIPCYQYGRYLRQCVASVLSQADDPGVGDIRVLIIDNASTDDSVEIARGLAALDARITVLAHPVNLGATASYNAGVAWAASEFFLLLDADDLLAPGCLSRAVAALDAHPGAAMCYGIEDFTDEHGDLPARRASGPAEPRYLDGEAFVEKTCRNPRNLVGSAAIVRRTAMQRKAGFYRPELPFTDDLEMWLRLACFGGVVQLNETQGIRRVHAAQMSTQYRDGSVFVRDFVEREAAFESFFRNEGNALPDMQRLRSLARRGLGEHAYWSAISHLVRGHLPTSRELLRFARRLAPYSAIVPPFGYLLRMNNPLSRVRAVLGEALGSH